MIKNYTDYDWILRAAEATVNKKLLNVLCETSCFPSYHLFSRIIFFKFIKIHVYRPRLTFHTNVALCWLFKHHFKTLRGVIYRYFMMIVPLF
jgi:hypothetical protein